MPDGLSYVDQGSFASGAFPQMETVPPDGAEDIVNGVVDEDGASIFPRGGSTYVGSLAGSSSQRFVNAWRGNLGLFKGMTVASLLNTSVVESLRAMPDGAADFTEFAQDNVGPQRPVTFAGMLVLAAEPAGDGAHVRVWGGDVSAAAGFTGATVTVTNGSATVTGSGFSAGVAPGQILASATAFSDRVGVVASVISDTEVRLLAPWKGPTTTGAANFVKTYSLSVATQTLMAGTGPVHVTVAGNRLVLARGTRVAFTSISDPFVVSSEDYWELPAGAAVLGLEPLRDQAMVFTTRGAYAISSIGLDLTDAVGNQQQRLDSVSPDVVLWDDRGIAGWENSLVAPCMDEIYLLDSLASRRPITGGMRALYRSYVRAGYRAGAASVFRSRYFLPIINGGLTPAASESWVDTLVCDLRSGTWTRWDGTGGAVSALAGSATQLFAVGAQGSTRRVHDLAGAFVKDDSSLVSVALERAEGKPGQAFTALSSPQVRSDAGESIYTWAFNEQTRAIRFRLTVSQSRSDADGSSPQMRVTTRTSTGPGLISHMWRRFRARMEGPVLRSITAGLRVSGKYRP